MSAHVVNLQFRPATYWDTPDALLANIKGEQRRQLIQHALAIADAEELETWLLQDELTDEERELVGRIHPLLMGGEYLPDYQPGEVEIARVALQSTTGDVISVGAR